MTIITLQSSQIFEHAQRDDAYLPDDHIRIAVVEVILYKMVCDCRRVDECQYDDNTKTIKDFISM